MNGPLVHNSKNQLWNSYAHSKLVRFRKLQYCFCTFFSTYILCLNNILKVLWIEPVRRPTHTSGHGQAKFRWNPTFSGTVVVDTAAAPRANASEEHQQHYRAVRSRGAAATAQLSPEMFDPRKMNSNFLDANFGYLKLSTARVDRNNENCPSYFLVFGLKSC